MAFNQGCRGLIPRDGTWGPYLLYLLKSRVPELSATANGTTFVELSRDDLASVRISIPPLETQQRIAAFLDVKTAQIDALIANKQTLLQRLAEKRQAIITQAVTKGVNPRMPMKDSGIAWMGQIPAHWHLKRLRYLLDGDTRNGLYKPKDQFDDEGVPFVQMGEAFRDLRFSRGTNDRVVSNPRELARWGLRSGDFLIARRSIVFEGSGKSVLIEDISEPHLFESSMIRIRPLSAKFSNFLNYYFQSSICRAFFLSITKQVTISGIDSQQLKEIAVPVLEEAEADKIVESIEDQNRKIDIIIKETKGSIASLHEYRISLISAAVAGQLRGLV
jgi:type I restriction enzyme S subunit